MGYKETRNAYMREWRKRNPEKVKATQERYWNKKLEEFARENAEAEANNTSGGEKEKQDG